MAKQISSIQVTPFFSTKAAPDDLVKQGFKASYVVTDDSDADFRATKSLAISDPAGTETLDAWWVSIRTAVYTAEGLTPP